MIIFSDAISEDDKAKLEALGHTVVKTPSNQVTCIDDGGDVHTALDSIANALTATRDAVAEAASCIGGGYRESILAKLNAVT